MVKGTERTDEVKRARAEKVENAEGMKRVNVCMGV